MYWDMSQVVQHKHKTQSSNTSITKKKRKENTRMANKYIKRCSTSMSLGNWIFKTAKHYVYTPVKQTKIQNPLVRYWSNRNSHSLMAGMQNSIATLEDSSAVKKKKSTHTLTKWSSEHAPWYLPNWNLCSHKSLHKDVISTHNCPILEGTKMSFSR
jgi:hypothetical protein